MFRALFRRSKGADCVNKLHGAIVAIVRHPDFYTECGAPDTFEGRFELLALFSSLVVRRLARLGEAGGQLAQELTDHVFTGLDDDLREKGISDTAVPKRMKNLAAGFLGRRGAYDAALAEGAMAGMLAQALARNVFGGAVAPEAAGPARLARYVRLADAALARTQLATFETGEAPFPDLAASLAEQT